MSAARCRVRRGGGKLRLPVLPGARATTASSPTFRSAMNDDLASDERLRACSHFAHRARHELLTPLSGLSMLVSLLQGRDPELDDFARKAEAATKRIAGLVRACTDYVDAELPIASLADVDLDAVFRDAEARLRADEPRFGAAIVVRSSSLPRVRGHAGWLQRVVRGLLDNAARYSRSPARIEVSARVEAGRVRVEVADRGVGLAREQCELVLQPFERLHAWDDVPGFGLSLATARRALRRLDGDLGLEPRDGGGLVAWFALAPATA